MNTTKLTIVSCYCYLSLIFTGDCINAQAEFEESITLIRVADDVAIKLDGRLSEDEWQLSEPITNFRLINQAPDKIVPASQRTTAFLLYNNVGLYIAFELRQPSSSLVKIHSAQDRGSSDRDFVTVALDTSGSGQYGNYFTLYLGGSKADGVLAPERSWIGNWDGVWYGQTAEDKGGWTAEIFIPWSILSLPKTQSDRRLGLFLARKFARDGEYFGFPAIHNDAPRFLSDFTQVVVQNVKVKRQLSIFPFISSQLDTVTSTSREHYGVDVFWRPVPHLQVTGTLQPDFGTVEADDVIINLSAFESFFPDRRLFFVEGREIFLPTRRAYGSLVPFHSRRIGDRPTPPRVSQDVDLDLSRATYGTELYGALKGTGQLKQFRYGILGAWEKDAMFLAKTVRDTYVVKSPGREFGVFRFVYENSESTRYGIGLLSAVSWDELLGDAYTHSLDARFQSESGRIRTESQVIMTDVADQKAGFAGFVDFRFRQSDALRHSLSVTRIDPKFDLSRTGFASRADRTSTEYSLSRVQYQTPRFREVYHSFVVSGSWNSSGDRTDAGLTLGASVRDRGQNAWSVSVSYKPSYIDDATAYRDSSFKTKPSAGVSFGVATNSARRFTQTAWFSIRESRIQGKSNSLGFQLVYRPWDSLTINWQLSKDANDGLILYRGNLDFIRYRSWSPTSNVAVQFFPSTRQRFRLDFQCRLIQARAYEYLSLGEIANDVRSRGFNMMGDSSDFSISRATLQLRYRWEIAPLSDLYIVYTRTGTLNTTIQNSVTKTLRETVETRDTENVAIKFRWRTPLDY